MIVVTFSSSKILAWIVICLGATTCIPISKLYLNPDVANTRESPALLRNPPEGQLKNTKHPSESEVLLYLRKFGYLTEKQVQNQHSVQEAVKSLRSVFGLELNNGINTELIEHIRAPRCGNPDIEPYHERSREKRFAQVSKWTDKMTENDVLRLNWSIERYSGDLPKIQIREIAQRAFKLWSDQSSMPLPRTVKLEFSEAHKSSESDITISWAEKNHGDAYPFDGPGNGSNVLAHTFYPNYQQAGTLNGDIHLDDFENWVADENVPVQSGVYLPYVLAHEIGHALGLGHSKRQQAIMNPEYKRIPLKSFQLDIDDQCAINWNYVGISDKCLFIWLVVEILPNAAIRHNDSKLNGRRPAPASHLIGAPPDPYISSIGMMTMEEKIDRIFRTLQIDKLEHCKLDEEDDEDIVKDNYRRLLIQKLDCTSSEAAHYATVICRFISGLRTVVRAKKSSGISQAREDKLSLNKMNKGNLNGSGTPLGTRPETTSLLSQFSVHSYHKKFYRLFRNSSPDHRATSVNHSEIKFSNQEEGFDESFFRSVLKSVLKA